MIRREFSKTDILQLILGILLLSIGLLFGLLASMSYSREGFLKDTLGFIQLRPLHVSCTILWIIISAQAMVNMALQRIAWMKIPSWIARLRLVILLIAVLSMFFSYFTKNFGGREYWEFPPHVGFLFLLLWICQLLGMLWLIKKLNRRPVYIWMWFTGAIFLIVTFVENYAWLLPSVSSTSVTDLTVQWKSAGSMVGAWNQMVYGLAAWLMTRLGASEKSANTGIAFALYFLGLTNLMFNWGHHIYTLPTAPFVRYISYAVSMTEWVLLLRIIRNWRKELESAKKLRVFLSYRFLMAADVWIAVNLILALFMSIPAVNLYTHGTHITVAHSMGTTIGINSMILLAVCCRFLEENSRWRPGKFFCNTWWVLQIGLGVFWLSLLASGIGRSIWQMRENRVSFQSMMHSLKPWYISFSVAGSVITIAFWLLLFPILTRWWGVLKSSFSQQ